MARSEPSNRLQKEWKKLQSSDSKSLLKKDLTPDVFEKIRDKKTRFGASLLDIIQSGVVNLDSSVGAYAADAESYFIFAPLFDKIIASYHGIKKTTHRQPPVQFGDPATLTELDPEDYPFNSLMTKQQYQDIETKMADALGRCKGELQGTYYPLTGMDEAVRQKLVDDHFLFQSSDRFLEAANARRFWPVGRGIFHNREKTFLVWVNEEDHVRIISMQQGSDLKAVYSRLVTALGGIEQSGVNFTRDNDLGYLTFCPTNLGTTIRASVHIRLPRLGESKMKQIAENYGLQVRGSRGEHSDHEGDVYDISNKSRLGVTEYEAVKTLQDGILEMIKLEESS